MIVNGNDRVGEAEAFKTPREMALHNLNLAKDEKIRVLEGSFWEKESHIIEVEEENEKLRNIYRNMQMLSESFHSTIKLFADREGIDLEGFL